MSAQLDVRIKKQFPSPSGGFLLDVGFSAATEITAIFGPSGAGKTTILECIAGLVSPDDGRISLGQMVLFDSANRRNARVGDRGVGYVFQTLALFPHLTARENIEFGLLQPLREREQAVAAIMETLRIAHVADHRPDAISGGERQRVALARSLVVQPRVLLLDEAMSALDHQTKSAILSDLRAWHARHSVPVLYVTHSIEEVFAVADRVLLLEEGRVTGEGKPGEVLRVERDRMMADLQAVR